MSEVFALSTTLELADGDEGYLLKDNNCEYQEEYLAHIFDANQARAITTAINNHDQLTDENARLREALRALVREIHDQSRIDAYIENVIYSPEFKIAENLLNKDTK